MQFAQKLVDCGELYMRPAEYYIQLEYNSPKSKQGDKFEGACSHRVGIAKGVNHPIYCMMQIMSGDIKKDATGRPFVNISSSLLNGFLPMSRRWSSSNHPISRVHFQVESFCV